MTKLKNKKMEEILSDYSCSLKNIFNTITYVFKIKSRDTDKKVIVSINEGNKNVFLSFVWIFIKYLIIAIELLNLRSKLFSNLFYDLADPFEYDTLARLIDNQSKYWLDNNHLKIKMLEDFLFELLEEPTVAEKICESTNANAEEYQCIKTHTRKVFSKYILDILQENYDQIKALQNKKRPLDEKEKIELYKMSFNDTTLLDETEE